MSKSSESIEPQKTSVEINDDLINTRSILADMIAALTNGRRSRERSLVITKLEEASMWASAGLARE